MFLLTLRLIGDDILAADFLHPVDRAVVKLFTFHFFAFHFNSSHHDTMLAEHFGEATGVDACNARYLFAFQP